MSNQSHTQSQSLEPEKNQAPNDRNAQTTRLLLICHAEGMHNRYQNLTAEDSGLTAVGWQQAEALAFWLRAHVTINVLVSGPQLHSRLTAQRIGQALGLPVSIARDMPGQFDDVDGQLKRIPVAVANDPLTLRPEIGTATQPVTSSYATYHAKLITVLNRLLSEHAGKTLALVTSRSVIGTIVRHFFGGHTLPMQVAYAGLSELTCEDGRWLLGYLNRREHEPMLPLTPPDDTSDTIWAPDEDENLALIAQVYNSVANDIAAQPEEQTDREQVAQHQAGQRARVHHFLRWARLAEGKHVLDIGSGTGTLALAIADNGAQEVVGADISLAMLEQAEYWRLNNLSPSRNHVSYRLAPAQLLPFPEERFDVVICRMVIHESHKPEKIVRESVRVLKPGGLFILADLLSADDAVKRATQNAIEERRKPCHVAARNTEQYRQLLEDAGLILEQEEVVIFERELEDWLRDIPAHLSDGTAVREMFEASMETDAAGINARRQGGVLVFDQRLLYVRAVKG